MKIKKLPKEVLEKLDVAIVGNVFEELKKIKQALVTIDKLASVNNEDETDKVLNDIYVIAHAFSGHCKNPHTDWIKREEEIREQLKDY